MDEGNENKAWSADYADFRGLRKGKKAPILRPLLQSTKICATGGRFPTNARRLFAGEAAPFLEHLLRNVGRTEPVDQITHEPLAALKL